MPKRSSNVKPLYASFLENKGLYTRSQNYWQAQFDEIFDTFDYGYETYHADEEKRDGDPMFAAYFPMLGRAVRIVQKPPRGESLEIKARLQKNTLNERATPAHELIIELVLSKPGANLARQLIRQWITSFLPAEKMKEEISRRLP